MVGDSLEEVSVLENTANILENLSFFDLNSSMRMLCELGKKYPDGYGQGSAEAIVTDTVLLFSAVDHRFQGNPPYRFLRDYEYVRNTVQDFCINPDTTNYAYNARVLIDQMIDHLEENKLESLPISDFDYIYDVFISIVNPYLIRIGGGELDLAGAKAEIHLELDKWKWSPPVQRLIKSHNYLN